MEAAAASATSRRNLPRWRCICSMAARMLAAVFSPNPLSEASSPDLQAAARRSTESMPRACHTARAFFAPNPGMSVMASRPAGNFARSWSSSAMRPVAQNSATFSARPLPMPSMSRREPSALAAAMSPSKAFRARAPRVYAPLLNGFAPSSSSNSASVSSESSSVSRSCSVTPVATPVAGWLPTGSRVAARHTRGRGREAPRPAAGVRCGSCVPSPTCSPRGGRARGPRCPGTRSPRR